MVIAVNRDVTTDADWRTFAAERCPCHRERLILAYYPLVQRVAGSMSKRIPSQVDVNDLVQYGALGLIRAVEHYDPFAGVTFETYAVASIRGVMLDELRSLDWAPRSLRRRQREIDRATELLEAKLGREPHLAETARSLGVATRYVEDTLKATENSHPRSLDEVDDDDGRSRYEHVEDLRLATPHDAAERAGLYGKLAGLISTLKPQEQLVLALYYFEGLTLAQVGRVAGIPESRASQVHARLMMAIRTELGTLLQHA